MKLAYPHSRQDRRRIEASYAAGRLSREDYTLHRYIIAAREDYEARENAAAQSSATENFSQSNDTTNDDCHRRRSEKDCPKRNAEHCKEHRR